MSRDHPAMRSCPQCGRTYGDEYNFCLADGTLLSLVKDPNKTEVYSNPAVAPDSVPTAESHKQDVPPPTVRVPITQTPEPPLPTIAAFTPKPFADQPPQAKRSVAKILLSIAAGVVAVIVILGIIAGIVVGIVESSRNSHNVAANATPSPAVTRTPKPTPSPSMTPTLTPTPDPTPTKPIVITDPTLEPRATPTQMSNMEGIYYLREFNSDDTVLMTFQVYDQNGGDFYVYAEAKDLYGTVHLAPDETNHYVGYVVWKYASGTEDREIFYLCEKGLGFCGKLPGQSWYFVATKRSGD